MTYSPPVGSAEPVRKDLEWSWPESRRDHLRSFQEERCCPLCCIWREAIRKWLMILLISHRLHSSMRLTRSRAATLWPTTPSMEALLLTPTSLWLQSSPSGNLKDNLMALQGDPSSELHLPFTVHAQLLFSITLKTRGSKSWPFLRWARKSAGLSPILSLKSNPTLSFSQLPSSQPTRSHPIFAYSSTTAWRVFLSDTQAPSQWTATKSSSRAKVFTRCLSLLLTPPASSSFTRFSLWPSSLRRLAARPPMAPWASSTLSSKDQSRRAHSLLAVPMMLTSS